MGGQGCCDKLGCTEVSLIVIHSFHIVGALGFIVYGFIFVLILAAFTAAFSGGSANGILGVLLAHIGIIILVFGGYVLFVAIFGIVAAALKRRVLLIISAVVVFIMAGLEVAALGMSIAYYAETTDGHTRTWLGILIGFSCLGILAFVLTIIACIKANKRKDTSYKY